MNQSKRAVIIAGNWKMHKTIAETIAFIDELRLLPYHPNTYIYLAVPFTAIKDAAKVASQPIVVGAQNMNDASEGAFTGEIAGKMLKEAGAKFVILGHSERRTIFHESNLFINKKVKRALEEGLQVILCIGETKEQRQEGKTEEILKSQIHECLADISEEKFDNIILAYEPVWAIGTDQAATPEDAQKEHAYCRQLIASHWGEAVAEKLVIQYGGSVKANNAKVLLEQPDIDGLLVGGASLTIDSFKKIINY